MPNVVVRTFGFRLAAWYFALFVVGTGVVLLGAYLLLRWSLTQRDQQIVTTTLARYAAAYERGGLRGLDTAISADRATSRYEPLLVRVATPAGDAVHFSLPADWRRFELSTLADPRLLEGDGSGEIRSAGSTERLLIVSRVIGGRTLFQVGRSTQLRDELLGRFRRVAIALWGGASLLALLIGRLAAQLTLRPLRELGATIRRLGEGSATRTRVPVRRVHDELDELGIHVNRLLDRIDTLVTGMRQTLDAVAHDLRTPVTRLRAGAERALDRATVAADYREALAVCIEESDRLMSLLDALMDLAEAESGSMAVRRELVDLRSIAGDAVELYTPMADEKGVRVRFTGGTPVAVRGDRNRLGQAVANLLDNAVKYTPPGGRVDVDVRVAAENAILTVTDTGPGVAAHDLPRIWERLYRGDQSRSERGLGLGLSLVKAIVEAHGGTVTAESQPGSGSRFEMCLPLHVEDGAIMTRM